MVEEINKFNLIDNQQSDHSDYDTIIEKGKDVVDKTTLPLLHDDVLLIENVISYLDFEI